MLDVSEMSSGSNKVIPLGQKPQTDIEPKYLKEILKCLPRKMLHAVLADLEAYAATGEVSPEIEVVLQRARCLADADKINARH